VNYTVEWAELAVDELAAAWLSATDQAGATRVLHILEQALGSTPFSVGRPFGSSVRRFVLAPPVRLAFDIVEDDKKVIVQACWLVG